MYLYMYSLEHFFLVSAHSLQCSQSLLVTLVVWIYLIGICCVFQPASQNTFLTIWNNVLTWVNRETYPVIYLVSRLFLDFSIGKNLVFELIQPWGVGNEMWGNFTENKNEGWNYQLLFLPNIYQWLVYTH